MVKLLRITSEDNGNFKADLDAGIDIKENSSIALQNLTFETDDFTAFRVNSKNSLIQFDFGLLLRENYLSANLKAENYNKSNIQDFYKNLEGTLNRCLGVGSINDPVADIIGSSYANFMVRYDTFNFNDTGDQRQNDGKILFNVSRNSQNVPSLVVIQGGTGNDKELGNMYQLDAAPATNLLINYVYPMPFVHWCKGSSMFMCGIKTLVANGLTADHNGFSIGLSFSNLITATNLGVSPIPESARDFEIRIKRPGDFVEYVEPSNPGVNQISTYNLHLVTDIDQFKNDHILFEKKHGQIIASVFNSSIPGGVKTQIFSHNLTNDEMEKEIYPYISVFGAQADVVVGRPIVTINPFFYPVTNNISSLDNRYYQLTGINQNIMGNGNAYNSLTDFSNVVPYSDDDLFDTLGYANTNFNPKLRINEEVLKVLGFSPVKYPGNSVVTIQRPETLLIVDDFGDKPFLQFDIVSDGLNNFVNSDNYIVLLDSNPLYSYDASKFDYSDTKNPSFDKYNKRGRRINILATIPKNDNQGIVEYEPNELTFIDFDNGMKQTLKNIRLRVLDKDFNEIKTFGESIMTLLIKEGN
jgi:hypothetical protein